MANRKDKDIINALDRDLARKALDRSAARDELIRKEENEAKEDEH